MRKLSYFILGIIILFVLIFAITPLFIGSQVKNYLNTQAAALQKKHPGTQIDITQYQRHWFSSDATFTLHYKLPFLLSGGCQSTPITITLNAHIKHGPLITYSMDGKKYHQLAKSALILTNPNMDGQVIALSDWHHGVKTIFDVESFADKTATISFLIKELTGYIDYNHASKKLNYAINLAEFQHSKQLASGHTDMMQSTHNTFKGTMNNVQGLWIGTLHSSRDHLSITRNKTAMLTLKNVQTTLQSKSKNKRANYNMSMTAQDLTLAGEQLGALSWHASLTNADTNALAELQDRSQKICSSSHFSLSNLVAMTPPLLALVEKGVTLNIQNLTLTPTDSGPISLTASMQFIEAPQGISVLNALKYMSANANVSLPRAFLLQQLTEFYQNELVKHPQHKDALSASEKASATVTRWIKNKMLFEKTNQMLETNVSIKNDTILINGKAPKFDQ